MANSIPDINLATGSDWTDVYATTSIPVGTSIIIQNKSSYMLLVYISATKPTGANDGYVLKSLETASIDASESGCWIKGVGSINVQRG